MISITPFTQQGALDEDGLRSHLNRLADAGIGVYVVGSGSGAGYSLTPDETERIMAIAVEELKGRVPVRAMGSEPRSVEEMVRFIQQADAAGVDAVHIYSIEPGHGYVPNAAEIEAYLRVALDATTKPAVLSSHMSVGYMIPHDVLDRLVDDYPNIIGIVISSMFEMRYLFDVIDRHGDRLEVISGGGLRGLLNLTFGGAGFATTEANIAPRLAVSIIDHFKAGDAHAMLAVSRLLTELSIRNTWYRDNASSVKAALAALGLPGGPPRRRSVPTTRSSGCAWDSPSWSLPSRCACPVLRPCATCSASEPPRQPSRRTTKCEGQPVLAETSLSTVLYPGEHTVRPACRVLAPYRRPRSGSSAAFTAAIATLSLSARAVVSYYVPTGRTRYRHY